MIEIEIDKIDSIIDYLYELASLWEWKNGNISRYQKELDELNDLIRYLKNLRECPIWKSTDDGENDLDKDLAL